MKKFLITLLTAVTIFSSTIVAKAETVLPDMYMNFPSSIFENAEYIIMKSSDVYYLYCVGSNYPLNDVTVAIGAEPNKSGSRFYFYNDTDFNVTWYSFVNGENVWQQAGSRLITGQDYSDPYYQTYGGSIDIIYSEKDIYNFDTGIKVFPLPPVPLAEEIRNLTEETMTVETIPQLNQTVLVVVLCGVGCLALLIALPLLRKVLFRFLG